MTGATYNIFASPLTSVHALQARNQLENDANCMGADDSLRAKTQGGNGLNNKQRASLNIDSVK
jgi:hypothetical protein